MVFFIFPINYNHDNLKGRTDENKLEGATTHQPAQDEHKGSSARELAFHCARSGKGRTQRPRLGAD